MLNPIAFGCLLSGAAGIAFTIAVRNLLRAKKSSSWPTVDCTIVDAQVMASPKGSRPKIVYRYRVAGRDYESARVVIGGLWETSGDGSAQMVQRFPKSSVAAVALDPGDPAYSVLIPGVRLHQVLTAIFSAVIFIATLPVLWMFTRLVIAS